MGPHLLLAVSLTDILIPATSNIKAFSEDAL